MFQETFPGINVFMEVEKAVIGKKLSAYLANPRDVTAQGLDQHIKNLKTLNPKNNTPEGNLLNCLQQLKGVIEDPLKNNIPKVPDNISQELSKPLTNICEGLKELDDHILFKSNKLMGGYGIDMYGEVKNWNHSTSLCPTAVIQDVLTRCREDTVNFALLLTDSARFRPNGIAEIGKMLTEVDIEMHSPERNKVGQALLDEFTKGGGHNSWMSMAKSENLYQHQSLRPQVEMFQKNFPGVSLPVEIKDAVSG
jgi:hypothetical protein